MNRERSLFIQITSAIDDVMNLHLDSDSKMFLLGLKKLIAKDEVPQAFVDECMEKGVLLGDGEQLELYLFGSDYEAIVISILDLIRRFKGYG